MPKQTASINALLGKNAAKLFNSHKNDKTEISAAGDLPPGIEGGVARVVTVEFKANKNGDPCFIAQAVVVAPKMAKTENGNDMRIAGLRTSIYIGLEAGERQEENLARALNEIRKLGLETSEYNSLDALSEALPALVGTTTAFRTWKGKATKQYPDPRTNHTWMGYVDDDAVPSESYVEDETGSGDSDLKALGARADEGDEEAIEILTAAAENAGLDSAEIDTMPSWVEVAEAIQQAGGDVEGYEEPADEDAEPEEPEEAEEEEESSGHYAAIGAAADAEDEEALAQLSAIAEANGVDPDLFDSWTALGEEFDGMKNLVTDEETEEEAEDTILPSVDDTYMVPYADTGDLYEAVILAVDEDNNTCDVQFLDDQETQEGVPWSDLQLPE